MTATEFRKAAKAAKRIFAYVPITDRRNIPIRISKSEALGLVKGFANDMEIKAEVMDINDTSTALLIAGRKS